MTVRFRIGLGATATAVALAACTSGSGAAAGEAVTVLGLEVRVPAGFERQAEAEGEDERPRDDEILWIGPSSEDGTAAGISIARLCAPPLPSWHEVRALAADGEHTGWSSYRLGSDGLEEADVDGALDALLVRGTFQLEAERSGTETTVLHGELLIRSAEDVIHRVAVWGTLAALEGVPVDEVHDSVRIVSTACPV